MRRALATTLLLAAALAAGSASAKERLRPVQHEAMSECPEYGRGFVKVPGTSTCIKISGRVRMDQTIASGRARRAYQSLGPAGSVAADVRAQTGAGPIRGYVRMRAGGGPYGR
ncbi:porin [Enterovirga rhinocerotis]|uniref:Porin n=1 Tax=Enterovirga rhinocerotis TaxID=1339210 RepID=A0A4R7BYW9_9HYPH|nr:porin [Enterovirga rhinocerotis]TDR89955.1 porin-like protein [Enterovirga rhinocerotis]